MVLHPQPAYPWRLELGVRYELTATGLAVSLEARNGSDVAAPFGVGFHPYLAAETELVDEALLAIPADRWIETDQRGLPIDERSVVESEFDFRSERAIGPERLDTAFTDLTRGGDGRAVVTVRNERLGSALSVWMDEGFRYVQVYTGDTLEPVERRRRGIAIEPMTCPANAFRTGTDVIRLEPGGSWRGRWGISVREGQ
jgi:aldose 1-epimerase